MKFAVLFTLVAFSVSAQNQRVSFYTRAGNLTDSADSFYDQRKEGGQSVSRFTATGQLRYREVAGKQKGQAMRTYYHPDGSQMTVIEYRGYLPNGKVKLVYPDGADWALLEFGIMKSPDDKPRIIEYWDPSGKQLITRGNGNCICANLPFHDEGWIAEGRIEKGLMEGEWVGRDDEGGTYAETYKAGKLVEGKLVSGDNTYRYTTLSQSAEPAGGLKIFYQQMLTLLKYPAQARDRGIEGKVFVEFEIDPDGVVRHIAAVKGIDPECDAEAERAVFYATEEPWMPGRKRGRPVKTLMVLPITFSIN